MDLGTLEKLVKFLDQSLIGIIVLDKDLTIKYINENYEVFFLNTFGFKLQKHTSLKNFPDLKEKNQNFQKFIDIWSDVFNGESFYDENQNFYGNVTNQSNQIVGGYSIHSGIYNKIALKKLIKIVNSENAVLERANHELRTPLVSIVGSAQLLDLTIPKTKDYDKYRDHIKCILQSSEHLRSMIEDFMDFSRIASNQLILDNSCQINVKKIIEKCVDIMNPQAESFDVTINIKHPENNETDYIIKGDPNRFSQILINILSNAIKYNKKNGKVVIEYKLIQSGLNYLKIDIVDTGIGMSDTDIKTKLFKEYSRFGLKTEQVNGSGLGLALSKKLIDLMHGKIYIKSKIDVGSRFSLIFKLEAEKEMYPTDDTNNVYIIYLDTISLTHFTYIKNILNMRYDNRIKILSAISVPVTLKLIEQYKPAFLIVDDSTNDVDELVKTNVPMILLGTCNSQTDINCKKINKPLVMEDFLSLVNEQLGF
jgi:nitrogen-specific signal transduction histidine kinase